MSTFFFTLACECYVMSKYSFEIDDAYSVIDWAILTYNKWLVNQPKCVDIDQLHYFIKSASIPTGIFNCITVYLVFGTLIIPTRFFQWMVLQK